METDEGASSSGDLTGAGSQEPGSEEIFGGTGVGFDNIGGDFLLKELGSYVEYPGEGIFGVENYTEGDPLGMNKLISHTPDSSISSMTVEGERIESQSQTGHEDGSVVLNDPSVEEWIKKRGELDRNPRHKPDSQTDGVTNDKKPTALGETAEEKHELSQEVPVPSNGNQTVSEPGNENNGGSDGPGKVGLDDKSHLDKKGPGGGSSSQRTRIVYTPRQYIAMRSDARRLPFRHTTTARRGRSVTRAYRSTTAEAAGSNQVYEALDGTSEEEVDIDRGNPFIPPWNFGRGRTRGDDRIIIRAKDGRRRGGGRGASIAERGFGERVRPSPGAGWRGKEEGYPFQDWEGGGLVGMDWGVSESGRDQQLARRESTTGANGGDGRQCRDNNPRYQRGGFRGNRAISGGRGTEVPAGGSGGSSSDGIRDVETARGRVPTRMALPGSGHVPEGLSGGQHGGGLEVKGQVYHGDKGRETAVGGVHAGCPDPQLPGGSAVGHQDGRAHCANRHDAQTALASSLQQLRDKLSCPTASCCCGCHAIRLAERLWQRQQEAEQQLRDCLCSRAPVGPRHAPPPPRRSSVTKGEPSRVAAHGYVLSRGVHNTRALRATPTARPLFV